jgi:16S rRNA (adenine1518-N6/adenine1519-N6)-dimethyltransferase
MQRLGQHFLKNKSVLQKIVTALELAPGDVVFEIGSGHGELTMPLASASEKFGCKIIAIEKDAELVAELTNGIPAEKTSALKNIDVVHGDVLKILAREITSRKLAHYKIVGNIPYYITGKLLRTISELEQKPERVVLTIQKEVAERICDTPPDMNRLAASVQFWAEPKIIAAVPKNDFSPAPKIDSAVIALTTKRKIPVAEAEKYYQALRTVFAQPRKTILNNIAESHAADGEKNKTKQEISDALQAVNVNPADRPQNLSVEDIVAVARALL